MWCGAIIAAVVALDVISLAAVGARPRVPELMSTGGAALAPDASCEHRNQQLSTESTVPQLISQVKNSFVISTFRNKNNFDENYTALSVVDFDAFPQDGSLPVFVLDATVGNLNFIVILIVPETVLHTFLVPTGILEPMYRANPVSGRKPTRPRSKNF